MRISLGNLQRRSSIPSKSNAPAFAAGAVILAGYGLSMAASLPGHLSYDSVIQLLEGRSGAYSGWHPAVMSWLLGLSDAVRPGAGLFVLGSAALLFGSLLALLWIPQKVSWIAPAVALFLILTPQLLLYQGIVWKDVLFANAGVASFAALAHVAAQWANKTARLALIGVAILLLTFAALARQNGILLLPIAGLALGVMAWRNGRSATQAAALAVCSCFIVVLLTLAATAALATRIVAERGASKQVRLLELYDLAGALQQDPQLQLPDLQRRDPALLDLMRSEGAKVYSPIRSDRLIHAARLQAALGAAPDNVLHRSWAAFVVRHPTLYLRNRGEVFGWTLLTPGLQVCVPYVVGLRGPPDAMRELGLKTRVSPRDKLMDEYGEALVGTPLFSHAAFLLLCIAELGFLSIRRRASDMVMIAMLAAAIVFAASFFFISIACDYRYLYFLDLASLVALFHIALDPGGGCDLQRGIVSPALQRTGEGTTGATDSSA
jgi:hypothetical protein